VLAALVDGSTTAAWADEPYAPGSGSTVVARPEGEGLVLDGVAPAVEAGAQADHLVLTAGGPGGRYQVLVPARRAGLSCAPLRSVDVVRRFASVRLDNVVMAPEEILSGPGAAEIALERQRQVAAVLALSEVQGAIDAVFALTLRWMFDRYTFGRPIASYQALKHRTADMKVWLEACRATVHEAVGAVATGGDDAAQLVSVAKSYVGDHAPELVQECVQFHGGIGVTWDHDLHLYLRRVILDVSLAGTVRDHRRRLGCLVACWQGEH